MGQFLSKKLYRALPGMIAHWCPGCKERHFIYIKEEGFVGNVTWDYNNNPDKPTFFPSVRHSTNRPRNIAEMGKPVVYTKCHYFIRDGMIEFCPDSRHELAGQTVELPDFPSSDEE